MPLRWKHRAPNELPTWKSRFEKIYQFGPFVVKVTTQYLRVQMSYHNSIRKKFKIIFLIIMWDHLYNYLFLRREFMIIFFWIFFRMMITYPIMISTTYLLRIRWWLIDNIFSIIYEIFYPTSTKAITMLRRISLTSFWKIQIDFCMML